MQRSNYYTGSHWFHKSNPKLIIRIIAPEAKGNIYLCHSWVEMVYTGIIRVTKVELDDSYDEELEVKPDLI